MINAGLKIVSSPLATFNTSTLAWDHILVTVIYPAETTQNTTQNPVSINDIVIDTSGSVWKVTNVVPKGNFDFEVSLLVQNKVKDENTLPNIGDTTASINTIINDQVAPYWNSTYVNANVPRIAAEFNINNPINLDTVANVFVNNPIVNQVLQYNGTIWANATINIPTPSISTLTDVQLTAPTGGQILQYNGLKWVNSTFNTSSSTLSTLVDTAISAPTINQVLRFNGSKWANANITLSSLSTDILIVAPTNGQVLKYDGTKWINGTLTSGPTSLSSLTSDVTITMPAQNQVLTYRNGKWINSDTQYKIVCTDWSAGQFIAPTGWTVTKVLSDSALQITHNLNSIPTRWSGINTASSPNLSIVPTATRNMQVDSASQVTLLQVGTMSSFKLYIQFE